MVALEATSGGAEKEQPVAFDTGLSAPTCEALVALAEFEDRFTPGACCMELHVASTASAWGFGTGDTNTASLLLHELRTCPTHKCIK